MKENKNSLESYELEQLEQLILFAEEKQNELSKLKLDSTKVKIKSIGLFTLDYIIILITYIFIRNGLVEKYIIITSITITLLLISSLLLIIFSYRYIIEIRNKQRSIEIILDDLLETIFTIKDSFISLNELSITEKIKLFLFEHRLRTLKFR